MLADIADKDIVGEFLPSDVNTFFPFCLQAPNDLARPPTPGSAGFAKYLGKDAQSRVFPIHI